jgi:HAD superfamily phosphoserine phosphatase-like hydrolase
MNYQPYPEHYWTQVQENINTLKASNKKLVAAFDADGTLWDADLGENFFQYQIDHKLVELPPQAFDFYLAKKEKDPRDAFLWLAQINKGRSLEQVREWAKLAFNSIQPNPIFNDQQKLIQFLMNNGVEVYIVTASIKWAVEPGAQALGISASHVIGVQTEIQDGLVTEKGIFPITYREGKVEALLLRTGGIGPFLSSGNSMGDFELLHAATHTRLAVSAASRDDHMYKTESELLSHAKNNNWLGHRFI